MLCDLQENDWKNKILFFFWIYTRNMMLITPRIIKWYVIIHVHRNVPRHVLGDADVNVYLKRFVYSTSTTSFCMSLISYMRNPFIKHHSFDEYAERRVLNGKYYIYNHTFYWICTCIYRDRLEIIWNKLYVDLLYIYYSYTFVKCILVCF